MYKHSVSRNQRSKRFKVRQVVQICGLVAVCFWLIYQVKHSHDKKKAFEEGDASTSLETNSRIVKFGGRKDIQDPLQVKPLIEDKKDEETEEENEVGEDDSKHEENVKESDNKHEESVEEDDNKQEENREEDDSKHEENIEENDSKREENGEEDDTKLEEEEQDNKNEEKEDDRKHEDEEQEQDNKNEHEEEEQANKNEEKEDDSKHEKEEQEQDNKNEEKEDGKKGDGDDEIDKHEQEKSEMEIEHEVDVLDEERDTDEINKNEENENGDKETQTEDGNHVEHHDHETREEQYKGDDASSAVTHDSESASAEKERGALENPIEKTETNGLEHGNVAVNNEDTTNDQTPKSNFTTIETNNQEQIGNDLEKKSVETNDRSMINSTEAKQDEGEGEISTNPSLNNTMSDSINTQNLEVGQRESLNSSTATQTDVSEEQNLEEDTKENQNENSESEKEMGESENENGEVDLGHHDPIDDSDSSISLEKDVRMDLDTLPDIRSEVGTDEEAASE